MCANSEGSGETARMHRLVWAFAGRLSDKYHNLMSWLNWTQYVPTGHSYAQIEHVPARHDLVVDWAVKLQHKQNKLSIGKCKEKRKMLQISHHLHK